MLNLIGKTDLKIDLIDECTKQNEKAHNEDSVSFLFAGDYCVRYGTEKIIVDGGSQDILKSFVNELEEADLSMINLEAPLTAGGEPIKKSGPNIKMDPNCIDFLKVGGFDIASLANNHMGDYGPSGVLDTISHLKDEQINYVGAGETLEDSREPLIIEKNGISIGILAYAENEFGMARKDMPGASPLQPLENIKEIKSLSKRVDVLIVSIHGGNEHNPIPTPRVVRTYRSFVEAGATVVVAAHTHCPQGMEIYQGAPIIYSLGNFLFDRPENRKPNPMWWKSYAVRIHFNRKNTLSIDVIPYDFGPDATSIKILEGKDKEGFISYLNYISDVIANPDKLMNYWKAWVAIHGTGCLNFLNNMEYPAVNEEMKEGIPGARNILNCQAHNELLSAFMEMVYRDEVEEYKQYEEYIRLLQQGCVPKA